MPRSRNSRGQYMRDRAERRMRRDERRRDRNESRNDYGYQMDYRNGRSESRDRNDFRGGRDRSYPEEYYMDYKQSRERDRMHDYDMRRSSDYRDYADEDLEKEYHEDLKEWTEQLKRYDKFGLLKDQILKKARDMGVQFEDYEPEEFYAIYLMHVSDYSQIANEPNTYIAMTKAWLEDKDIKIEPSEKVCKYMYEIAMAEEDDD